MEKKGKLLYLDGLRGLMAINVVLCHFIVVYFPEMYFKDFAEKSTSTVLSLFAKTPLSVLINGDVAVCYFFVLTGLLVARSVFSSGSEMSLEFIGKKCQGRYTRFLPMIVLATFFTYITMKCGLQYHLKVAGDVTNTEFLLGTCNFKPSLWKALFNSFFLTYVDYNAFLKPFWTMHYEFWGYIACLLLCCTLKKNKWRKFIVLALIAVLLYYNQPYWISFLFGILVADLNFSNADEENKCAGLNWGSFVKKRWFLVLCFIVGLYFACCPMYFASIYSFWDKISSLVTPPLLRAFGVAVCVHVIINQEIIQKILEWKPFLWLGKHSFSVYSFHWPVMLSLEAFAFSLLKTRFSYQISAVIAFLISVPIIYLISCFADTLIDRIPCFREKRL